MCIYRRHIFYVISGDIGPGNLQTAPLGLVQPGLVSSLGGTKTSLFIIILYLIIFYNLTLIISNKYNISVAISFLLLSI